MQDLVQYKKQFDRNLTAFFNARLGVYKKLGKSTLVPKFVSQSAQIALGGGKRFRPYLATLAYESFGGRREAEIVEVSLAIELFHLFALIHDDIMDQADVRHGLPTVHALAVKELQALRRRGDAVRTGDSQAILVGDLALAWSIECMGGRKVAPNQKRRLAMESFYNTLDEVVIGQMIEVDATTKPAITLEELAYKHLYKSARYSFVGPIKTGIRLATGKSTYDLFADKFGGALGMAFQVQDDLLDAFAEKSSKGLLTDVVQGQPTYLTYYVLHKAKPQYKKEFLKYFAGNMPIENIGHVTDIYVKSGAFDFAQTEMKKYFKQARAFLARGPIKDKYRAAWEGVVDLIESRKS